MRVILHQFTHHRIEHAVNSCGGGFVNIYSNADALNIFLELLRITFDNRITQSNLLLYRIVQLCYKSVDAS